MGFGAGDYELRMYFIIPIVAGIVGWVTNVLALKMTFYPTEYVGIDLYRIKNQPWGFFGIQVRMRKEQENDIIYVFSLHITFEITVDNLNLTWL